MNNQYIKQILTSIILLSVLLLCACDDYLSKSPDNRLELDSEIKIKKLMVSAYPKSSYWRLAEMASDNADENGGTAYSPYDLSQEQAYRWQDVIGEDVDSPYDIWSNFYVAIMTSCAAIDALDELKLKNKISSEEVAAGLESEALLCRAYGHFVLVNLFSKTYGTTSSTDLGIPYVTEPEKNLIVEYERGTVEDVYAKIEKDLEDGLKNVTKIKQDIRKYHWTKEAAYAFAARFYLYYKKYDKAIEYANKALGDDPSLLFRDWRADGAKANNLNIVFDKFISDKQSANFLLVPAESLWGRISGPYNIGLGMALQGVTMREIAPNGGLNIGGKLHYGYSTYVSGNLVVFNKYTEYFEYYDKTAGIGWTHIVQVLFSPEETLLTRAEAYALSNLLDDAAKDLDLFTKTFTYNAQDGGKNWSKERIIEASENQPEYEPTNFENPSGKKEINLAGLSSDQKNMLNPILQARRILTLHEGLRWFDINRYEIKIYRRKILNGGILLTDELKLDDPRRTFQIPQQMVAAGIEPNPR